MCCFSVTQSCLTLCNPMDCSMPGFHCSSWKCAGVSSNSCPLNRWCHPTISFSVTLFSSCPQSFPTSESFPMSHLFPSSGQSIGASVLAWGLPMSIQGWFPLGPTDLISLLSKGLSRISNTTVQFFGAQSSLSSNSHIHTWPMEKP